MEQWPTWVSDISPHYDNSFIAHSWVKNWWGSRRSGPQHQISCYSHRRKSDLECIHWESKKISSVTVEPWFNEVAGDRPNLFVKSRVRYIENLDIMNLRGNDQNVCYIEVIVNDWFSTQETSVTQSNAIFVTQKCRVLRCNSLSMVAFSSNYFHFWADVQILFTKKNDTFRVLICSAFIFCRVLTL